MPCLVKTNNFFLLLGYKKIVHRIEFAYIWFLYGLPLEQRLYCAEVQLFQQSLVYIINTRNVKIIFQILTGVLDNLPKVTFHKR